MGRTISAMIILGLVLLGLNLTACANVTINPEPNPPDNHYADTQSVTAAALMGHHPLHFPPEILDAVRQDLTQQANVPPEDIQFLRAQPMTWPDGCLGLAQPDEFCTQALVDGWQMKLSTGDRTWVYRTDNSGHIFRLAIP